MGGGAPVSLAGPSIAWAEDAAYELAARTWDRVVLLYLGTAVDPRALHYAHDAVVALAGNVQPMFSKRDAVAHPRPRRPRLTVTGPAFEEVGPRASMGRCGVYERTHRPVRGRLYVSNMSPHAPLCAARRLTPQVPSTEDDLLKEWVASIAPPARTKRHPVTGVPLIGLSWLSSMRAFGVSLSHFGKQVSRPPRVRCVTWPLDCAARRTGYPARQTHPRTHARPLLLPSQVHVGYNANAYEAARMYDRKVVEIAMDAAAQDGSDAAGGPTRRLNFPEERELRVKGALDRRAGRGSRGRRSACPHALDEHGVRHSLQLRGRSPTPRGRTTS